MDSHSSGFNLGNPCDICGKGGLTNNIVIVLVQVKVKMKDYGKTASKIRSIKWI